MEHITLMEDAAEKPDGLQTSANAPSAGAAPQRLQHRQTLPSAGRQTANQETETIPSNAGEQFDQL